MSDERKPGQYIVTDLDNNAFGPFDSAVGAAEWAAWRWPDVDERDETFGLGWEVRPLTRLDEPA